MTFEKVSEEVFVSDNCITVVGPNEIEMLKASALRNRRKRVRLCAHGKLDDSVHEMLIVHTNDTYVRPHRHPRKTESFHIIEGELDVIVFDEGGAIQAIIEISSTADNKAIYYRLAEDQFHTVIVQSDISVFHETTRGPFRSGETEFADWSPPDSTPDAVRDYLCRLHAQIESFRGNQA